MKTRHFTLLVLFALGLGLAAGLNGFSLIGRAKADGNDPSNTPGATAVSVTSSQAATICVESNVAAAAQATVTIPACGQNQFFYLTNLQMTLIAIAAPAATLMTTTSTNMPGSLSLRQAVQAAVGTYDAQLILNLPLKSSGANTATVFTGPAGLANVSQNLRACGLCAK